MKKTIKNTLKQLYHKNLLVSKTKVIFFYDIYKKTNVLLLDKIMK